MWHTERANEQSCIFHSTHTHREWKLFIHQIIIFQAHSLAATRSSSSSSSDEKFILHLM